MGLRIIGGEERVTFEQKIIEFSKFPKTNVNESPSL